MFIHIYSIAVLFLPVLALWALGFGVRVLRTVVIPLRGLHTSRRDVLDGVLASGSQRSEAPVPAE